MHKRKFLYLVTSMGVALVGAGALVYAASIRTVDLNDQCDPDTFNAAVGPGRARVRTEACLSTCS